MTDHIPVRNDWTHEPAVCEGRSAPRPLNPGRGSTALQLIRGNIYDWSVLPARMARIAARTRTDRIYCFRHGETKYNERKLVSGQHDTVLSARGREAAMSLRESLPQPLDLIVCSGLTRAIETMRLSVPPHIQASCPIWADRRLNEVNLGVLQGKKSVFIHQFAAGELSWAPAGGESYRDAAQRVFSSVVDIYDELAAGGGPPKRVAVFCHAGVMRIIGTLIDPHADSRNVFKSSAKNLECLVVSATDVSLPAFWREGDRGRDGQDNPRQDQRS